MFCTANLERLIIQQLLRVTLTAVQLPLKLGTDGKADASLTARAETEQERVPQESREDVK